MGCDISFSFVKMEPTGDQPSSSTSQGEVVNTDTAGSEAVEALAAMRWQREDGRRISRRETGGVRPSVPHRLSAMANAGQSPDDDEESEEEEDGGRMG